MNVWIVNHYAIPPSMGGLVRHYYFSKYLQKKGHDVSIMTSARIHNTDINMQENDNLFTKKKVDGVEYTFIKSTAYSGNGLDRIINMIDFPLSVWKTMNRLLKTERPDVIYTSSPDLFVAATALVFGKMRKIPIVVEVRDLWPESIVEYNGMSRRNPIICILYAMEKWIYKKADRLIFTMEGGNDYICDKKWEKDITLSKIEHVNNGIDFEEYNNNITKYKLEDADLLGEDKFKVVYVGSIRKANNIENLVKVAERLREDKDILFLIYGDGNEREPLEQKCKELGLDNICFKGRVDKKYVPFILSKSSLNILNYKQADTWKYGGSQNKQFEYLASGKPICSNVKMGYSIIEKNCCGMEENIDSIARYVEIILKYKNMGKRDYELQCKNAKNVAKNYDYNILGEKIERILRSVCS